MEIALSFNGTPCEQRYNWYASIYFYLLYDPFLWMEFNCLKATEPLRRDSLLLTIELPVFPGTHSINLRRMKG